jgi:hypothetical protein
MKRLTLTRVIIYMYWHGVNIIGLPTYFTHTININKISDW